MIGVSEVIVVEGRYDKNTLSQIVDAVIIELGGFAIFRDKGKLELLRKLAAVRGLIVMTDSDAAGLKLRNYLKGSIANVKHAYIPDVQGHEKRKSSPSKEGKLGVEGMRPEILIKALERAGATFTGNVSERDGGLSGYEGGIPECGNAACGDIDKADLYTAGLSGGAGSSELRRRLLRKMELPENLSANSLLDVLNALITRDEFLSMIEDI